MPATILVVDDDANVRELLKLHLGAAGYEVHVAADAIAAGYLVLRSPPDLLICDVNMPHMDGFEFVSALKADTTIPHFPVIFLTTFEEGDERGKELVYNLGLLAEATGQRDEARSHYIRIYEVDIGYRDVAAKMEQFR